MSTFQRCDKSVEKMASEILKQFETHKPLLDAKVQVDYLFAYAPKDNDGHPVGNALTLHGTAANGICRILPLKQRAMGRGDGEISIDGDWWGQAGEEEQRALLDHELHHLAVRCVKNTSIVLRDDLGRPLLKMRKHDVDFGWFKIIAERHGDASAEVRQAKQLLEGYGQYFFPDLFAQAAAKIAA